MGQRRIILQCLTHPALGLIRCLGRSPSIQQILDVTEVVHGPSADCHTLLLKFHDSLQGTDETATCYLQRLQRLLRRVVDSGEIAAENEVRDLLRQFCRGSYEDQLITNLRMESALDRFDEFCRLLAAVHNEEIRRNDKSGRLARVAVPKSKTKTVALSETVQQQAPASNGQHSSKTDGQSLQKTLTDALALELQRQQKWVKELPNLNVGDLVLLLDESSTRVSWPLGLVKEIYVGRDSLVRSVRVKTGTTEFVRPITKLVVIEGALYE